MGLNVAATVDGRNEGTVKSPDVQISPNGPAGEQPLAGQTFVVTGTLEKFDRPEIEALIVKLGGKASGSVSKKASFLIAGENAGSKLAKAKELGVSVLTEAEFIKKFGTADECR